MVIEIIMGMNYFLQVLMSSLFEQLSLVINIYFIYVAVLICTVKYISFLVVFFLFSGEQEPYCIAETDETHGNNCNYSR